MKGTGWQRLYSRLERYNFKSITVQNWTTLYWVSDTVRKESHMASSEKSVDVHLSRTLEWTLLPSLWWLEHDLVTSAGSWSHICTEKNQTPWLNFVVIIIYWQFQFCFGKSSRIPCGENTYVEIFGFAIWARWSLTPVKNHLEKQAYILHVTKRRLDNKIFQTDRLN